MLTAWADENSRPAAPVCVPVSAFSLPWKVRRETDVFPTGYMAAENCDIETGDTVAIWGCGPVGLFAIRSAYMLGAENVIAIDRFPERLKLAKEA